MPARYRKLRKIADGGMAELFLATQRGAEGFERKVVLKQILAPLLADPKFRNMLIDEAHVAMSLHHSNIAQVLDLGQSKGRTFLVLELVDGWDLNHILGRVRATGFPLPPELCLYVTAEICRALAYAHAQAKDGRPLGIVHRDISPHNVLVSEEGEVKLTDFGIAKAMGRREHTGQGIIKGKLAFMSPEQASGQELDARSDLFSVGTMLYLLFTGRRPFEAPTDLEIVLRVRQCAYTPPAEVKSDLPKSIARLIEKAMSRNPADRYQTGEELLLDLESAQRTVFAPAGQTELRRWLRKLGEHDQAPTISRAPALAGTPDEEVDIEDEDIVFESGDTAVDTIGVGTRRNKTAPSLAIAARALEEAAARPFEIPADVGPAGGGATGTDASVRTGSASLALQQPGGRRWLLGGLLAGAAVGAGVFALLYPRLSAWLHGAGPAPAGPAPAATGVTGAGGRAAGRAGGGSGGTGGTPGAALVASSDAADGGRADADGPVDARDARGDLADARRGDAAEDDDDEDEESLLRKREPDVADKVIGEESAAVVAPAAREAARPKKPEPARASKPPTPTSVRIESKPDGAVVKLGSRVFGRAPLSLRFNPGVTYELIFVKSGYVTARKRFNVTGRAGQKVTATLKKKPQRRRSFFERLFGR